MISLAHLQLVNPVASPHFNFSVPEPMGVVAVIADEESPLLGLVSVVLPAIAGGNTCIVLASESKPLSAVTLAKCSLRLICRPAL